MKKRIISLLLVLSMVLAMVVLPAAAADANRTVDAYCEYCKSNQTWQAVTASSDKLTEGHYFLGFDGDALTITEQKISGTVCLLLDNKEYVGNRRITLNPGAVLSVQGSGKLTGRGADNFGPGGAVYVKEGATLNLYSGTIAYKTHSVSNRGATNGGAIAVEGTFNMYGGTVKDGNAQNLGGSIYVGKTGRANLYGGSVLNGTAATGNCIYNAGIVTLGSNTFVDEILQAPATGGPALGDMLSVQEDYTGTAKLTFTSTLSDNTDIGNVEKAALYKANIQITGNALKVRAEGQNLIAYKPLPVLNATTGAEYNTLAEAVLAATAEDTLKLQQNIQEDVTAHKTVTLDLDGCYMDGTLSTGSWGWVYVKDSQTADYTVEDGICGGIKAVSGNVFPAPAKGEDDPYYMLRGDNGVSFHALGLDIITMSLRPSEAGLYYTADYHGDSAVADQVACYGIALSIAGDPSVYAQATVFTKKDGASFGIDSEGTSSMVTGIMKPENSDLDNAQNAGTVVYARSYVMLKDGIYLYGKLCARSLVDQLRDIDAQWSKLNYEKKSGVLSMYNLYGNIMDAWELPNIRYSFTTEEEETLKILSIGQSHSQDSVWLVQEVLQTELPDEKFFVAECIKSVTMVDHVANAKSDAKIYTYYTNTEGRWVENENWSIRQALLDQRWDIIIINESSRLLGLESTMELGLVNQMVDFVLSTVNYDPQLLYNWTWTTPTDQYFHSDTIDPQPPSGFWNRFVRDYQADREVHYNAMLAMLEKYVEPIEGIDGILYSATPIQYATEVLGVPQVDMYRDYIHLSDYGRLYIAYLWYAQFYGLEEITQVNVDVIEAHLRQWRWVSKGDVVLTEQMKQWIIESVNYTLQHPKEMPAS
ncbi:MAG: DUF4886 domain-containing protein [Oscillospiraceae bacterium]|nr:DUF4886 domain-containing protein [Oscillospiraceae bacterium]